jgi:hypothetical protein
VVDSLCDGLAVAKTLLNDSRSANRFELSYDLADRFEPHIAQVLDIGQLAAQREARARQLIAR